METETERVLEDGWLDTQDLGFIRDANLFITGRKKDVIIIRGGNLDPTFIERTLMEVPELRTGCYTVFSTHMGGEGQETEHLVVVAEVRNRRTLKVGHEELGERIRKAVFREHRVSVGEVALVAPRTIPRTSSGKIKRFETRQRWASGKLEASKPSRIRELATVLSAMAKGILRTTVGRGDTS